MSKLKKVLFYSLKYLVFCFAVLGILVTYMVVETWGALPRSQSDSTTIDEAIAAQIQDHVDEPSAHAATGQSLAAHREDTVIDHPAGSIPFDKRSLLELRFENYFNTVGSANGTGNFQQNGDGTAMVDTFHGSPGYSDNEFYIPLFQNISFPNKEITVQWMQEFNWSTTADKASTVWGDDPVNPTDGFGFVVESNVLKAALWHNSTRYVSSALTYTKGQWVECRIHIVPAEGKARYYIGGVVVAEINLHTSTAPDFGSFWISADDTSTTYAESRVSMLQMGYLKDLL